MTADRSHGDQSHKDCRQDTWRRVAALAELPPGSVKVVRVNGRQVALFQHAGEVYACNNLCPHQGYPLSKGTVAGQCILTCNWHNWKFNLKTGENLYGGDRLTIYPVEVHDAGIWVDLADPPFDAAHGCVIKNLRHAFDDESYDRIAREIARLIRIGGGDPLESLRHAVAWSWERLEFGWSHAYAGMADWLALYRELGDDAESALVTLVEPVAHTARDVLREGTYPYGDDVLPWEESAFLDAVEAENQGAAVAMVRGGLRDGLGFGDLERGLSAAALAHYNDFGHSLIYVSKVGDLISELGEEVAEPLLLSLVRSIVFATREDLIPEFRHYRGALDAWGDVERDDVPGVGDFSGLGIQSSLGMALAGSRGPVEELYRSLLLANASNMLRFDLSRQLKTHVSISGNIDWLDFTHAITFANAVRKQCSRFPELWPNGLLQMACFHGRNSGFTTEVDPWDWTSGDPDRDMGEAINTVMDHGQAEPIVSVHLLKTTLAVRKEIRHLPPDQAVLLTAALRRFLQSPLKRRHTRRTAWQSLQFIARESGTTMMDPFRSRSLSSGGRP